MNARMPMIDAAKGLAAQIIVLHHLSSYGPIAEQMNRLLPAVSGWFFDYGRMAVQVFLVISGFLAARGLAANGVPSVENPVALVWRRYLRLIRPFLAAILLAIACAALARAWMESESIPDAPNLWQVVAHGLLLHGIFDVPSLSVGIWYVAVDFQLYVLMLALLWLARHAGDTDEQRRIAALLLVSLAGAAALFYFNLNPALDNWAIYFFGSYAMGALSYWLSDKSQPGLPPWCWLLVLALVGAVALAYEYRTRIALALVVALAIGYGRIGGLLQRWPASRVLAGLGQISYSVFLVHFPVCLVVNAVFAHFTRHGWRAGYNAALIAWVASTIVGAIFYRYVETRKQWWPAAVAPVKT